MTKYYADSNMGLSMQVYLATDNYEHSDVPNQISATSLLKPVRQAILGKRIEESGINLEALVASRIGTSIHDGIEKAWTGDYKKTLKALGYVDNIIERICVNVPQKDLFDDAIPIYMEQRTNKEFNGYIISGKFDFISNGVLEDFKSCGTYSYMNQSKDTDYILQGSIYRWLNPTLITDDQMVIQFIFTDWSALKAKTDVNYPKSRIPRKTYQMLSIQETERFIKKKTDELTKYTDTPEDQLPLCNEADLWRSEPVFKYYKNPDKTLRSTKNFPSKTDAYMHLYQEGVGIVLEKPGQVMACKYCNAFSLCTQKDRLIETGELVL